MEMSPENRAIDIAIYQDQTHVICEIQDHAGGIKEEIIENIFNPFVTSKSGDKGSGLGLYMSKMIIESSMHGEVYATNKRDGACFVLKFLLTDSKNQ